MAAVKLKRCVATSHRPACAALGHAPPPSRLPAGDAAGCTANYNAGGWGPRSVGSVVSVPNRNVFIANNLFYNPPGQESQASSGKCS